MCLAECCEVDERTALLHDESGESHCVLLYGQTLHCMRCMCVAMAILYFYSTCMLHVHVRH